MSAGGRWTRRWWKKKPNVDLAEMSDLLQEVLHEFGESNFVVKRTDRQFNQVSADQSTEWLNATGKRNGGSIGITRISSAISRWAMSFNLRKVISSQTATMLGLTPDDEEDVYTLNECSKTRMERDDSDEGGIVVLLQQHCVFRDGPDTLSNIMNNDLVTPGIQDSLLGLRFLLGHGQMEVFVARRLCEPR